VDFYGDRKSDVAKFGGAKKVSLCSEFLSAPSFSLVCRLWIYFIFYNNRFNLTIIKFHLTNGILKQSQIGGY
jgi:hypothetical protein